MLNLQDFETIFLIASLFGALLIASPALAFVFPTRSGERFSELYVLGPNRMAEGYPFNVKAGETYRVYLGIGNHMGSSAYYVLYVKLRSQDEPLPNSTSGLPSPLPSIWEYRFLLRDGEVWERLLEFSIKGLSFSEDGCSLPSIVMDGLDLSVGKLVSWNTEENGYFLQLFFELWIYDPESGGFSFHNRFVGLWLNMTG